MDLRKEGKMSSRKKDKAFIMRAIHELMANAEPEAKNWVGKLEYLRNFICRNMEENEWKLEITILCFEKAIAEMKERFSSSLLRHQEIHMEICFGHCFEKFGAYDKALSSYQRALGLCDKQAYFPMKTEAIRYIGHIYLMKNEWDKASYAYQESLQICQDIGDREGEAYALSSLGIINFEQGKLSEALNVWEMARELTEKLSETKLIAQIYNNLGALMSIMGRWEKALSYYRKGASLFEKHGEYRGLAETYHNIAMMYADATHWSQSSAYYEKCHEIAKAIGDIRLQAMVKLNRVELYLAIGDFSMGLALCDQALQIFLNLEDHLGEAEIYKFLGMLYTKRHEWDLAGTHFTNSINLARQLKNPLLEGEACFEFGKMHRLNQDRISARKFFKKALKIFKFLKAERDIEKVEIELSTTEHQVMERSQKAMALIRE